MSLLGLRGLARVVRAALVLLFLAGIVPPAAQGGELQKLLNVVNSGVQVDPRWWELDPLWELAVAPPSSLSGPPKSIAIPVGTTVLVHFFGRGLNSWMSRYNVNVDIAFAMGLSFRWMRM